MRISNNLKFFKKCFHLSHVDRRYFHRGRLRLVRRRPAPHILQKVFINLYFRNGVRSRDFGAERLAVEESCLWLRFEYRFLPSLREVLIYNIIKLFCNLCKTAIQIQRPHSYLISAHLIDSIRKNSLICSCIQKPCDLPKAYLSPKNNLTDNALPFQRLLLL